MASLCLPSKYILGYPSNKKNFAGQPSAFHHAKLNYWPVWQSPIGIQAVPSRKITKKKKKLKVSRPRFNIGAKQKSELQKNGGHFPLITAHDPFQ